MPSGSIVQRLQPPIYRTLKHQSSSRQSTIHQHPSSRFTIIRDASAHSRHSSYVANNYNGQHSWLPIDQQYQIERHLFWPSQLFCSTQIHVKSPKLVCYRSLHNHTIIVTTLQNPSAILASRQCIRQNTIARQRLITTPCL